MNKKQYKGFLHKELNVVVNEKILPTLQIRITTKTAHREVAEHVHKLRVALKRLQSLWYLVVPIISDTQYQQQKQKIVTASKKLSVTRDEEITRVTLERLLENVSDETGAVLITNIYKRIQVNPVVYSQQAILAAQKTIKQSAIDFKNLHIHLGDGVTLQKRLIKALSETQKIFYKTKKNPSDKKFHELRKSSKRLLYQLCFLKEKLPKKLSKYIYALDELQDMLGFVHDLAVTEKNVLSTQAYFAKHKHEKLFKKCVDKIKKEAKKNNLSIAKKLLVNKGEEFKDAISQLSH